MGIRKQTTEEFKQKIFEKYNGKVEITGEFLGGSEPISFIYHCEKHGDIDRIMNAKNISSNKMFQPCLKCANENKSKSNGYHRTPEDLYSEFKQFVELKGGKLFEDKWMKSKYKYTIKCDNINHPPFTVTHDDVMHVKKAWCPYCCGREGNFQEEIKQIVESKNGELLTDYVDSTTHVKVKCLEHNHIWDIMPLNIKKYRWCAVCNMGRNEKIAWDYFTENNFIFKPQYTFEGFGNETNGELYKFDFGILNLDDSIKYLVEIDDVSHRSGSPKYSITMKNDIIKNNYCKDNNIPLLRIPIYTNKKFKDNKWYYNYIHEKISEFESKL